MTKTTGNDNDNGDSGVLGVRGPGPGWRLVMLASFQVFWFLFSLEIFSIPSMSISLSNFVSRFGMWKQAFTVTTQLLNSGHRK